MRGKNEKFNKQKGKYLLMLVLAVALVLGPSVLVYAESPLSQEAPGTIITFSGKQWIILEQMANGETYILLKDRDCQKKFDINDLQPFNSNKSDNIAYYLHNEFYNSLSQKLLVESHTWDATTVYSDGRRSADYSYPSRVGLLNYSEYRKYGRYYNTNGILPCSSDWWWWTLTLCKGGYNNTTVWSVGLNGELIGKHCNSSDGSVRPALYIKSGTLIDGNKVVKGGTSPPMSPKGLMASAESSTKVLLNWQANTEDNLAGYYIYRNNIKIGEVDKAVTQYGDETVKPGIIYEYKITTFNTANQESAKSLAAIATTPPQAPVGVTASAEGLKITLSWQAEGNQLYVVQRGDNGTDYTQVAEVTTKSYTETIPEWGKKYYYRVAQKGEDDTVSAYSGATVTIGQAPPIPPPTNLEATLDGDNVRLSWSGIQGAECYLLERSTNNRTWETLTSTTENTHTDQTAEPGTIYYYRVSAECDGQISVPSNVAEISKSPPAEPRISYRVNNEEVTVFWNYQECDGFRVYIGDTLVAEKQNDDTEHIFSGERGGTYTVGVEAYNGWGTTTAYVDIKISNMPTPGTGTMAKDVIKYAGATISGIGSLLALGLALQGNNKILGLAKLIFRR